MGELATCAASELAENLAEELGVRLVKKEAASIAVAFLTTEALKVCLKLNCRTKQGRISPPFGALPMTFPTPQTLILSRILSLWELPTFGPPPRLVYC